MAVQTEVSNTEFSHLMRCIRLAMLHTSEHTSALIHKKQNFSVKDINFMQDTSKLKNVGVFFATDNNFFKKKAYEMLGNFSLVTSTIVPEHLNTGDNKKTTASSYESRAFGSLVDWFTLAMHCDYFVGNLVSGYSRIAATYAITNNIILLRGDNDGNLCTGYYDISEVSRIGAGIR